MSSTELLPDPYRLGDLVGCSPAMLEIFAQVRRVAATDATVLITGESGTGKELVAEAIHAHSPRNTGPYSALNMAAVPETLVESELFGHVKGAFTGATGDRIGRFKAAQGGTLFIDEIGDLKPPSQAKLLRVLENRLVTPVGGNDATEVDIRVIAATNRPLEVMVAENGFREDLYYRLNVVTIVLPPLRERREDIPLLTEHFLSLLSDAYRRPRSELDEGLREFLVGCDWPGNVRQLHNCIESMVALADSPLLTVRDLPAMMRHHGEPSDVAIRIPSGLTLHQIEKTAILQALRRFGGNRTRAARSLGVSVRTLQRKLKRWRPDNGSSGQDTASSLGVPTAWN